MKREYTQIEVVKEAARRGWELEEIEHFGSSLPHKTTHLRYVHPEIPGILSIWSDGDGTGVARYCRYDNDLQDTVSYELYRWGDGR